MTTSIRSYNSQALACLSIALIAFFAAVSPAHAILFGLQQNNGNMVTVDPVTGVVTETFALPAGASLTGPVNGLSGAEGGTTLIYTNAVGTELQRIDPLTGSVLSTHALGIRDRGGLSFESTPGGDVILSVNDGAPLKRQDGYGGTLTAIGAAGVTFPGALGGDDFGRHFVRSSGLLREIDLDGNVLNGSSNDFGTLAGLAFDGTWLYGANTGGDLLTIDPDTFDILNSVSISGGVGDLPLVGLGVAGPRGPSTVPEGGPGLLAGVVLLGMCYAGRRKKSDN